MSIAADPMMTTEFAIEQGMRELFASFIPAILQTESGKEAFQTAYEVEEMAPVNDGYFAEFHRYMSASGLDFTTLVK